MPPRLRGALVLRICRGRLSFAGIELAQPLGGRFRKSAVEIDFFDAVGLAMLLDDRQDFDVPVIVALDGAPIFAELPFGLQGIRRGMDHHVIAVAELQQAPQACGRASWPGGGGSLRLRRFELMIVSFRHDPGFIGHARSIRAKGVVVADAVHDALGLANFLTQDVAEDAALALAIPFACGAEFVENAPRNEGGGVDLRMGVRPFLTGLRPLVLVQA